MSIDALHVLGARGRALALLAVWVTALEVGGEPAIALAIEEATVAARDR